jgi:hypothetical protein
VIFAARAAGHTVNRPRANKVGCLVGQSEVTAIVVIGVVPIARSNHKIKDGCPSRRDGTRFGPTLEIGADALVTHDRDFSKVRGISVLMGN